MKTSKMENENENAIIASMILSWLSILMLSTTGIGGGPTTMYNTKVMLDVGENVGILITINLFLLIYIDKRWTYALYIVFMTIVPINAIINLVDRFIYTFIVGDQRYVFWVIYLYGIMLIYLLTIILAITAIVEFVKSKINR